MASLLSSHSTDSFLHEFFSAWVFSSFLCLFLTCQLRGDKKGRHTFVSCFFPFSWIWGISVFFTICWNWTELSDHGCERHIWYFTLLSTNLLTTGTGHSSLHFTQLLVGRPRPENLRDDTLTKIFKVLLQLTFDILTYLRTNKVFISSPSWRATDFLLLQVKAVLTHLYSVNICEAFPLCQTLRHDLSPVVSTPTWWRAPPRILCENSVWWELRKPLSWCLNTTAPFTHRQSRFTQRLITVYVISMNLVTFSTSIPLLLTPQLTSAPFLESPVGWHPFWVESLGRLISRPLFHWE